MVHTAHGQALTALFDHIYIINLPYRTDRRAEIAAQLALLGLGFDHPQVTLFPAIRPTEAGDWPNIGTRGCYYSQMAVLDAAIGAGHSRIAIIEDDMDWSQSFLSMSADQIFAWGDQDWEYLHAGLDPGTEADAITLAPLPPDDAIMLTHFMGLRGAIIPEARAYLKAISERPRGSPDGGPMHVDGAYFWYRRAHPHRRAVVAHPRIALQRWSRTDIHDLSWKDRIPVVRQTVNALRRLRNRLLPR